MTPREQMFVIAALKRAFDWVAPLTLLGNLGASAGNVQSYDRSAVLSWLDLAGAGFGTVTSVNLAGPSMFSTTGPVTSSGTLSFAWVPQSANKVLAGPTTGGDANPTFRSLVSADLPSHSHAGSDITSGTVGFSYLPTGTGANQVAVGNHTHSYLPLSGGTVSGDVVASGSGLKFQVYTDTNNYLNVSASQITIKCGGNFGSLAWDSSSKWARVENLDGDAWYFNSDGTLTLGSDTYLHTGMLPTKPGSNGRYALRVTSGVATWESI